MDGTARPKASLEQAEHLLKELKALAEGGHIKMTKFALVRDLDKSKAEAQTPTHPGYSIQRIAVEGEFPKMPRRWAARVGLCSISNSKEYSTGGITMHPLRKLRESGKPTPAQVSELLAENIVFNSPILVRPIQGREVIAAIFAQSSATRGSGTYTAEFKIDERTTFLR